MHAAGQAVLMVPAPMEYSMASREWGRSSWQKWGLRLGHGGYNFAGLGPKMKKFR